MEDARQADGARAAAESAAESAGAAAEDLAAAALSLARRFAAGATMWCVAPRWPSHARHVAVEFVHPVIVGKRALPAVFVDAATAASTVRELARPGDVLLAVSTADDPAVADLLARADAWGVTSVWLGAGRREAAAAPAPRADHVVWLEVDDAAVAARTGDLVMLYHLLWELTHVVFEHPGLLVDDAPAGSDCADDICITCSDEGRVAEVRALLHEGRVEVVAGGRAEQVDGRLVGDLRPGDLVLVHAGVAVTTLSGSDD
ncbi:MAG TPA: HypC/HybG/HupF family hydrogenase formation chaperone [Acidimicrobiales bacterium]